MERFALKIYDLLMNNDFNHLRRVRCELCRRGLLLDYNVYDFPDGAVKATLYSAVKGYFWRGKNNRRWGSETLEIAGQITGTSAYDFHLYVFPDRHGKIGCKVTDLINVGGTVYRVAAMNDLYGVFWLLDLEVYPYAIPG